MKKFAQIFVIAFLGLTAAPVIFPAGDVLAQEKAAAESSPQDEVKTTIDALVEAVEKHSGADKTAARREALRQIINPRFDFAEMAKRSLGSFWNEINPEQQTDFVNVFSDLLAKTYLARIENIQRDTVKIDKQDVQSGRALVRTTVTNRGDTFPIDYRLLQKDGRWKVYDVVIENIGLVANYRTEFAGIIRKEKFEGLMKRLREKRGA